LSDIRLQIVPSDRVATSPKADPNQPRNWLASPGTAPLHDCDQTPKCGSETSPQAGLKLAPHHPHQPQLSPAAGDLNQPTMEPGHSYHRNITESSKTRHLRQTAGLSICTFQTCVLLLISFNKKVWHELRSRRRMKCMQSHATSLTVRPCALLCMLCSGAILSCRRSQCSHGYSSGLRTLKEHCSITCDVDQSASTIFNSARIVCCKLRTCCSLAPGKKKHHVRLSKDNSFQTCLQNWAV
jgi:hypothetical protein